MKIVIFSGTTEGRILSQRLAEETRTNGTSTEIVVCVATEYGREIQAAVEGTRICTGPLSPEEKKELLCGAALCVDATHPYATHISQSLKTACREAEVEYIRLRRGESEENQHTTTRPDESRGGADNAEAAGKVFLADADETARWLAEREGNILLTTGAKELPAFAALPRERLFPRVLPNQKSLEACEAQGIPRRNIIAMQGPFSTEMNIATIRQYQIRWLVTKDGGIPGGYPEKREAAEKTGITLLVLRRPEDSGENFKAVLNRCMTAIHADANTD